MAVVGKENKVKKLRDNVEVCLEREARQIQESERRELKPGEREQLRQKWVQSAERIDRTGKLSEIWNTKTGGGNEGRPAFGYFSGVNFDANGRIIRNEN